LNGFLGIESRYARGDDSRIALQLQPVPGCRLQRFFYCRLLFEQLSVKRPGVHRQHHPSRRILDELLPPAAGPGFARIYIRPGMADARRGPEHHWNVELLG